MTRPPPRSTLFPYTTLFRSHRERPQRALHRLHRVPLDVSQRRAGGNAPCRRSRVRAGAGRRRGERRSEEHTSELQSQSNLVCRLLLEKKKKKKKKKC